MSQTTIPYQFETYLQNQISAGNAPDMNEVIFAYIPDLDLSHEMDRSLGLPDAAYWVHQQDVDQVGKVGESAVAYSVVIPASVAAFTFNAIYLHDKNVSDSCGVMVYKIDETKEYGMSSTKTLLQAYSGAAEYAQVSVDAQTWQIDHAARLFGIDEQHRLSCLDNYGELAFISGFEVIQSEADYTLSAGVAYIGGLRAELENTITQTITTTPTFIYVDVYRDGSPLSAFVNNVSIFTTEEAVANYVDDFNKQHYVAKIATVNEDGSITDERGVSAGQFERANNAATNEDIDGGSTDNKHVKLTQFWRGINQKITSLNESFETQMRALTAKIEKERVSIGEIIEITGDPTNPATLKGYGTWAAFGAGLVTVGAGTYTDARGEKKAWADGASEGEYQHVQTEDELAAHAHQHDISATASEAGEHGHTIDDLPNGTGGGSPYDGNAGEISQGQRNTSDDGAHAHEIKIAGGVLSSGSGEAMNNIQPSIAVYRWKRTA